MLVILRRQKYPIKPRLYINLLAIFIVRTFKLFIAALAITLSINAQTGKELYRPVFHYSPGRNWMNDPNGLVYYNGKYHLFYQYNPNGAQWGNSSWGHAVSTDLINWEEKPVAIPAQNGMLAFSGSVVVDWNNTSGFGINGKPPLVAIYTGSGGGVQNQRLAYSNDEGDTWINYGQNPVLSLNNNQFRDPKVFWHEQTQKWIMSVSLGDYQSISFYKSADLKNWSLLSGFGSKGNVSGSWECPDLVKLPVDNNPTDSRWVLVHSVVPTAQYFIGNFDGQNFSWERSLPTGILIDDFEGGNYNRWTATGNSFGPGPVRGIGTYSGYLGNQLLNSAFDANGGQGKLTSSDFVIQKNFISFLIGGGHHPNGTYINLVINNQPIRRSTGSNENILKWKSWDVSSLIGQTAHIEVVDSVLGRWSHINIDHIIQTDGINDELNFGQVDYGKDFYALQTFSDLPNGRKVWMAWMNQWVYAASTPTTPWKGIMSIPREIKLERHSGQVKLVQKPVDELKTLRKESLSLKKTTLSLINSTIHNMINTPGSNSFFKQFELKAKITVGNKSGFSLKFKKNASLYTEFIFDFTNREIRFDRTTSTIGNLDENFKDIQVAPLVIENGYFDLQLFVDNCSAELFSAGGQVVMSNQIFPDSSATGIELTSLSEDFIFEEFDIWKLEKNNRVPVPNTMKSALFQVYPNPLTANNSLAIRIKDDYIGNVSFRLFNSAGMLISEFRPEGNLALLPENKFGKARGIYFLTGSNGQITQTEKLLILRN